MNSNDKVLEFQRDVDYRVESKLIALEVERAEFAAGFLQGLCVGLVFGFIFLVYRAAKPQ